MLEWLLRLFKLSKSPTIERKVVYMIKESEINPKGYTLTEEQSRNLPILLERINKVRQAYGKPMIVTSGIRSEADQKRINPSAPKSNHLKALACDISDPNGDLFRWLLQNLDKMKEWGLYLEDFRYTPTWVHFQAIAPASGKRIFVPSSAPAPAPTRWDGKYDQSHN